MAQTHGAWITAQMERRNMNVRQLADALEVTTQTVYGWQNSRAVVNEERIPRLAEVFGVSEIEARRGLGYWVPTEGEPPEELDREQLREALDRFRRAADDLERLINREAPPPPR